MKLLRYCLLLFVVIMCMSSVTSALGPTIIPDENQIFSGTEDGSCFVYGGAVTDTVTPVGSNGLWMTFTWYYPDGEFAAMGVVPKTTANNYYDTHPNTNEEGNWGVLVAESSSLFGSPVSTGSAYFCVAALPEFVFGSVISLLLAGFVYLMMRRNLVGSFNVNR